MNRDLQYYSLVAGNGRMVYIFKLSSGTLQAREAEEIAEKARSNLRGGDYVPDVVIMEGEPSSNPKLFGSDPSVSYIRSILSYFQKTFGIQRYLIEDIQRSCPICLIMDTSAVS